MDNYSTLGLAAQEFVSNRNSTPILGKFRESKIGTPQKWPREHYEKVMAAKKAKERSPAPGKLIRKGMSSNFGSSLNESQKKTETLQSSP